MDTWQALVLLRSEYRTARVAAPHVQNETLDHFALGTVERAEAGRIEEHTHQCDECRLRLKEARIFARLLGQMECSREKSPVYERRGEQRYEVADPATITVFHPIKTAEIQGTVLNVSRSGCRIRTSQRVYCAADVVIHVTSAAIFATVRYCRATGEGTFDIGMKIGQAVMGLDSDAAMDLLRSQLDASGRQISALLTHASIGPPGKPKVA
jgi:hypothetical protein